MTRDELIALIDRADPYGALHIIIDDLNCEDEHIASCRRNPDLLPFEATILDELEKLTVDERESVVMTSPY